MSAKHMTATWQGHRNDLPEGRAWLVTTEDDHRYTVTFYRGWNGLRWAMCRCAAYNHGNLCRHILFAAHSDSILTGVPMLAPEEIKKAPDEPMSDFEQEIAMHMSAEAEDRRSYAR
jgi:hypothetical protein